MAASFPGALPAAVTATPSTTLANAGHATALHQKDRDEIIALGTKVGLGTGSGGTASGTPATGTVLVGIGAGVSAWQPITAGLLADNGTANTVYGPSGYTTTPSVASITAATGVNVGSATGAGVGQIKTSSHAYIAGGLNVGTATSATAAGNAAFSGSLIASGGIGVNTTVAGNGDIKLAGSVIAGTTASLSSNTSLQTNNDLRPGGRIWLGGEVSAAGSFSRDARPGIFYLQNAWNNVLLTGPASSGATGGTGDFGVYSGMVFLRKTINGFTAIWLENWATSTHVKLATTDDTQITFSATRPGTNAYSGELTWVYSTGTPVSTIENRNSTLATDPIGGANTRSRSYQISVWAV